MFDALYVGATGMRAHEGHIGVIANNLANVNTTAYRREIVTFSELAASLSTVEPMALTEGQVARVRGAGSITQISASQQPGELKLTGEPLDIAIDGPGYIEVVRVDGSPAFTRAGVLRIDPDGWLTVADGSMLAARIEIPPDSSTVIVEPDGRIQVQVDAQGLYEVGQLELVTFQNPAGLEVAGDNLLVHTPAAGQMSAGRPGEDGFGILRQGALESSNVQLVDEIVAMLLAQRAFEMNSRVLQAADQMMAITNGLFRA